MGDLTALADWIDQEADKALAAPRGATIVRPVRPAATELPRWDDPHHCGDYARRVHTWAEGTGRGRAVWLVHECRVCGQSWDVLGEDSDESVLIASVYPVWTVTACGLCCGTVCLGADCKCPCHHVAEGVA